jgi:oxalate decarboxylase/phosphoglucose isomerase-like protein (cupin superfamily)
MNDRPMDLTSHVGSRLRALDALIDGALRPLVDHAVDAARRMLASSQEPFGWQFLDVGSEDLPDGIGSAAVFVLPAGSSPPGHHHPNSTQHMRLLAGRATVTLRSTGSPGRPAPPDPVRYDVGAQRPWLVIPQRVVHEIEVTPGADLVVLSFHTVPQEDLLEVSSAGERSYTDPPET